MKGLVLVPVCSENKELRGALQELEEQGTAVVLTEKKMLKMQEWMAFLPMDSGALMKVSAVWWKKAAKKDNHYTGTA